MSGGRNYRRKFMNTLMFVLAMGATAVALVPLASILMYVVAKGLTALNWDFFTQLPRPVGQPGGGLGNAIIGTIILVVAASFIGIPVGILAGIYLAEFGRGRLAGLVRFICDVMTGIPSIIVGIVVYGTMVLAMKRFSALAGAVALAVIMLPLVTRTTEEMLRLVPNSLREASLALGATRWRTTLSIVLRSAMGGIITGSLLAVARIAGETAPLLFTALNSRYWPTGLLDRIASLPVYIYTYATTPYEEMHRLAWGAALVLVAMVMLTSIAARMAGRRFGGGGRQ
ncbi:Phosphate transport system permease protein PstA [Moorella humiferrea]|uniref:Phosphate transport system permease protein PstA n=1 Tax=Neomoorella humiferrea TaxID=676965 RepID=A0A2T0AWK3_9FIRM|nr:phosphate ABC transporter permease PstA [Moorella humiferrea]PRR75105.1 Phosphate transport system permease protein PstA [Moorella humiferrea]